MTTMTTFSGLELDLLDLREKDISINDIAHALACCNQFVGQARWPISVAQHSLSVSLLCANSPYDLQGLLHDASKAYLGDMIRGLKKREEMSAYQEAEIQAQKVIYRTFECPEEKADLVEWADKLMRRYEYQLAFGQSQTIPGYGAAISKGERTRVSTITPTLWRPYMTWQEAEANFLARFYELGLK